MYLDYSKGHIQAMSSHIWIYFCILLIIIYDLENLDFPSIFGFEDQVPVLVWEGKCKVNFKEMMENMEFLYQS